MASFSKSRGKRFEIARLQGEGHTLEEAEEMVMKGNKNRARLVGTWRKGGAFPYGDNDKPQETFLGIDLHTAHTVQSTMQIHSANAASTPKPSKPARSASAAYNDPKFIEMVKALIQEALSNQSTAHHTAHAHQVQSLKLNRSMKNCRTVTLRVHAKLWARARKQLEDQYKGTMSLNRYIELKLWELVGRPDDLIEPG